MAEQNELIPIYIMGKRYLVPSNLTIMKAMEYAGYKLTRGVGCRGGFCGACATVYRLRHDYRLKIGLACQTVVEPDMYLAQIPYFPGNRADYRLDELEPTFATIVRLYPEVLRCLACGRVPSPAPRNPGEGLHGQRHERGHRRCGGQVLRCIMCGLCTARCPAEEVQYDIAILCRRLYGKYLAPQAMHLAERVSDIQAGKFDTELQEIKGLSDAELRARYNQRDIEPE